MIFESFVKNIQKVNILISELEGMYGKQIRVIQFIPKRNGFTMIYETITEEKK